VLAGRWLVAVSGTVTTGTVAMLHPSDRAWLVFASVSAIMIALLALSFAVPWRRLPTWAPVVFPLLVQGALAAIGLLGAGLAAPYGGLTVLCFGYLGFTQPPRFSRAMLPLAAGCFIASYGHWSAQLGPRLLIATAVWAMVGEISAAFVREHAALTDALRRAAHTDVLTGLANRRDLLLKLATALPGDCVAICDIDHFKVVNDTHGHSAGDRVLADFGALLRACVRENDYVARYGGEEFAILLPSSDPAEAAVVLARLHSQWRLMNPALTFSSGVAVCRSDRSNDETLAAADAALYVSKRSGRDCDQFEAADAAAGASQARLHPAARWSAP